MITKAIHTGEKTQSQDQPMSLTSFKAMKTNVNKAKTGILFESFDMVNFLRGSKSD